MMREDGQPVREATAFALMVRRRECGLTQVELAERVGLSQTQIARLELGQTSLTIEHFFALAKALNITRTDLWARIENAARLLTMPAVRTMFLESRVRVRAPKVPE